MSVGRAWVVLRSMSAARGLVLVAEHPPADVSSLPPICYCGVGLRHGRPSLGHNRAVDGASRIRNHLLAASSDEEASLLEPWLEVMPMPRGYVIARPG